MTNSQLPPPQAVRYINTWLSRNNYSGVFPNDLALLLAENRRITRSPNVIKYGRIPFSKDSKGRISYRLEDIRDLCNNAIKPICEERLAIQLAKADAVAAGRNYYFKPATVEPEVTDEQLV
ncbi:hypothetical protein [Methylobacter tundripaludum]|uniref:Uncharacterized protein n=1 Tax=Methylobacter tundripaludum (strain ATCC BAA-1195 / DSM 17260 / SV96) TaxID=697282 RepID=G3J0A9_METTV|nr:hypothetical protein [Methylobacter tundripaludum]EGW20631.1 hypothetical protein Mettu_3779 [Methylobacter tundripaludum SV96]